MRECQRKVNNKTLKASLTFRSINFKIITQMINCQQTIKKFNDRKISFFENKTQGEKSDDEAINL